MSRGKSCTSAITRLEVQVSHPFDCTAAIATRHFDPASDRRLAAFARARGMDRFEVTEIDERLEAAARELGGRAGRAGFSFAPAKDGRRVSQVRREAAYEFFDEVRAARFVAVLPTGVKLEAVWARTRDGNYVIGADCLERHKDGVLAAEVAAAAPRKVAKKTTKGTRTGAKQAKPKPKSRA